MFAVYVPLGVVLRLAAEYPLAVGAVVGVAVFCWLVDYRRSLVAGGRPWLKANTAAAPTDGAAAGDLPRWVRMTILGVVLAAPLGLFISSLFP